MGLGRSGVWDAILKRGLNRRHGVLKCIIGGVRIGILGKGMKKAGFFEEHHRGGGEDWDSREGYER